MCDDELISVYKPADLLEADAIKQYLDSVGIPCYVDGEAVAGWAGAGAFSNIGRWRMQLLVRKCDAQRAASIIEEGDWPKYT